MTARILIVEDERAIQLALSGLLRREGYDVEVAGSGDEATARLGEQAFDLVLTDLALGRGPDGMDVLRTAKKLRPETVVVMITAHGSERVAVNAANLEGSSALHIAAALGDIENTRRLLVHGADPGARDGKGNTPLMLAEHAGHSAVSELLEQHTVLYPSE